MYRNKAIKKGYMKPNLNLDIMLRSKSVTDKYATLWFKNFQNYGYYSTWKTLHPLFNVYLHGRRTNTASFVYLGLLVPYKCFRKH